MLRVKLLVKDKESRRYNEAMSNKMEQSYTYLQRMVRSLEGMTDAAAKTTAGAEKTERKKTT